ncbi:hypothetical protein ASE74_15830 [Pedobacter sp. Leaf216]|uniref:hypothetical protein n=1 Tax=Pedobacter sp. Leaf216 TaxID=1735684 RepID=UPI0006FA4395|nr:hypothetical protein [Pedobacter sp. Leaf216]KQM77868.1 hypothetical protein ASE74_15830 [Pedobacter sp. Leaf216]
MLHKETYPINFGLKAGTSATYQIEQQISYTVDGYGYHNEIKTEVQLSVEKKSDTNNLFSIRILKQWQLKNNGTDEVDLSMAQLRKELKIETDIQGNIQQVTNLAQIKEEWLKIRPGLAKKYANDAKNKELINGAVLTLYTDDGLKKAVRSSYLYHALLPGLLRQRFSKSNNYSVGGYREIRNAFGNTSLPFKTTVTLADYNGELDSCTIKIDGEIDRENFDQNSVTEMFSHLLDIYNLDGRVDGFHLESYEYDKNSLPVQSSQLTQYAIEGVLMYRSSCILTPLNN